MSNNLWEAFIREVGGGEEQRNSPSFLSMKKNDGGCRDEHYLHSVDASVESGLDRGFPKFQG